EVLQVTGDAHVEGITATVDDSRPRKQLRDYAEVQVILRQLVRRPPRSPRLRGEILQIFRSHGTDAVGLNPRQAGGKAGGGVEASGQALDQAGEFHQLPGAEYVGMAGEDLFDEGGSGARHADDKDRQLAVHAEAADAFEETPV